MRKLANIFKLQTEKGHEKIWEQFNKTSEKEIKFDLYKKYYNRFSKNIKTAEDRNEVNTVFEHKFNEKNYYLSFINEMKQTIENINSKLAKYDLFLPYIERIEKFTRNIPDGMKVFIKQVKRYPSSTVKEIINTPKYLDYFLSDEFKIEIFKNAFQFFLLIRHIDLGKIQDSDEFINEIKNIRSFKTEITLDTLKQFSYQDFEKNFIQFYQDETENKNDMNYILNRLGNDFKQFSGTDFIDEENFFSYCISGIIDNINISTTANFFENYIQNYKSMQEKVKFIHFSPKEEIVSEMIQFSKLKFDFTNKNQNVQEMVSKLPKVQKFGIKINEIHSFYAFWTIFAKIVTCSIEGDSILLEKLSEFISNEKYNENFNKHVNVILLTPVQNNLLGIFSSIVALFNSIVFQNKTILEISKNGINFLNDHPNIPYFLLEQIDNIIQQNSELKNILENENPVSEYEFVGKVQNGELTWKVSFSDKVTLINSEEKIELDYDRLQLTAARLNITMFRPIDNGDIQEHYENVRKFVIRFQCLEKLNEIITQLHDLYFKEGNESFKFQKLPPSDNKDEDVQRKIGNLEKILNENTGQFDELYNKELSLFTKEQIFLLYNKVAHNRNKQNNKIISKIIEGSFVSNDLSVIQKIIGGKNDFASFLKYLKTVFHDIFNSSSNFKMVPGYTEYVAEYFRNDKIKTYIDGASIRGIMLPNYSNIHSLALFILSRNGQFPQPNQLLICTMSTRKSQIDSFFEFFLTTKCNYFVIISPIQLPPDLYNYLIINLQKINSATLNNESHIVILYDKDDINKKPAFANIFRFIQTNLYQKDYIPEIPEKFVKEFYKPFFNLEDSQSKSYGISSYFIYTKRPRTGKTQYLLKHIFNQKKDHVYSRILIDESTTISQLINMLNSLPSVENNKTHYIHFNVDGHCKIDFIHFIQNIAFFRSLNDGFNEPFIYNENMIFYFEFGSRPSMDTNEFLHQVFPLGLYMKELKLPEDPKEIFTYDEYNTIPINENDKNCKCLQIECRKNYNVFIATAAALVKMDIDKKSFMNVDKSALHIRYDDYKSYYHQYKHEFVNNPKMAYNQFMSLYSKFSNDDDEPLKDFIHDIHGYEQPLISQIFDIAHIIYTFRGPILSKSIFSIEAGIGRNVRRLILGLLVETAIANCGLPYNPPLDDNGEINESSDGDTKRLDRFQKYLKCKGKLLAICNPAGDREDQSFCYIVTEGANESNTNNNDEEDIKAVLEKYKILTKDGQNNENSMRQLRNALGIIGNSEWREKEKYSDDLFEVLSSILNLPKQKKELYNLVMLILKWKTLDNSDKHKVQEIWDPNDTYDEMNKKKSRLISDLRKENMKSDEKTLKHLSKFYDFLNLLSEVKKQENYVNKPGKEIYHFINHCEKLVQNKNSLMIKYTLTIHNITRFVHLIYRIYSKVPIILMGETGSGKTFTMKFLAEIIGNKTELIVNVIDGSMTEERIRKKLEAKFSELEKNRITSFYKELKQFEENNTIQSIIKSFISYIIGKTPQEKDQIAYHLTSGLKANEVLNTLSNNFLDSRNQEIGIKYDVNSEEERESLQKYIIFNLKNILKKIDRELPNYIFFFDEVNTAPCQWFLKEVIIDRYFNGKTIPSYISFACAVNPSRVIGEEQRNQLDALNPDYEDDSLDRKRNLVYKVNEMPESFIPFLFPADPFRDYNNQNCHLQDLEPNSEFDISILKIVESNLSKQPLPFISNPNITQKENGLIHRIGDKEHFSLTDKYSISFDYEFFKGVIGQDNVDDFIPNFVSVLSRINIFSCRVLYHEIYKDKSFSSMRDPERAINVMRWAYQFGIYESLSKNNTKEYVFSRLRRAFIIGISVTFWLRLSSIKPKDDNNTKKAPSLSRRELFLKLVCDFWTKLIENQQDNYLNSYFKSPTPKEWEDIIQNECMQYANLFVENDECVSKNEALTENIWVTYICLMNNIPLWIIGQPGTSKSLAVNIVINKLMNHRSTNDKITQSPPLISQQFMCSNTTKTEMIKEQLQKIVKKGQMYKENYIIHNQILEEIGHADRSRYKPLVCLHDIIDNGYELAPNFHVPVVLIGLSNYKMDSAKLNRGILLLRSPLSEDTIAKTGLEIFESTGRALKFDKSDIQNSEEKHKDKIKALSLAYSTKVKKFGPRKAIFIGLRDYYGFIQNITKLFLSNNDINNEKVKQEFISHIRRNFSGILDNQYTEEIVVEMYGKLYNGEKLELHDESGNNCTINSGISKIINSNLLEKQRDLKTPIVRHIIISTRNNAAYNIIFKNNNKKKNIHFFFNSNLTDFTSNEWASNELRRLVGIMEKGETAVFIGDNQCFNGMYDIFNLRYQNDGIDKDKKQINRAMIAFGGDSYPTIVNTDFRVIIILEEDSYERLPQPFLNRFEKFHLIFDDEIETETLINLKKNFELKLKNNFKVHDLDSVFGCYSEGLFKSCFYLYQNNNNIFHDNSENSQLLYDLFFLSLRPGALLKNPQDDYCDPTCGLLSNSSIRSTLINLLLGYNKNQNDNSSLSASLYSYWEENSGIQAIIMTPSIGKFGILGEYGFNYITLDAANPINFVNKFMFEIGNIEENKLNKPLVLILFTNESPDIMAPNLLQFEVLLEEIKERCYKEFNIKTIHLLILIRMDKHPQKLHLNQSITWPLIYLDSFGEKVIKNKETNVPLDLEQLIFNPISTLLPKSDDFNKSIIDFNDLVKKSIQRISSHSDDFTKQLINTLETNNNSLNLIKQSIIYVFQNENASDEITESMKIIANLSEPPQSLLEFISERIHLIFVNIISIIIKIITSGIQQNKITEYDIGLIGELLCQRKYIDTFQWILFKTNPQISTIETRICSQYIGQIPLYLMIWDIALENPSFSGENIQNSFKGFPKIEEKIKSLFKSDTESFEIFIGCYLLNINDKIQVRDRKVQFRKFIKYVVYIIKHIFNKECHRPQELLVLLRNKNMINFFSDLAPLFLLFPTSDDFDCDSFFPEQIATQHFDTNEQPTDNYMLTLSAQIITVLCDYMPQMLKNVSMSEAYEIFAYHFSIIISKYNQFLYTNNEENDNGEEEEEEGDEKAVKFVGNYIFESRSIAILISIQVFFLNCTQLLRKIADKTIEIKIPENPNDIDEGLNIIDNFLDNLNIVEESDKAVINEIKNAMITEFIHSITIPYIGLIDDETPI